jgi:hypothetical protein
MHVRVDGGWVPGTDGVLRLDVDLYPIVLSLMESSMPDRCLELSGRRLSGVASASAIVAWVLCAGCGGVPATWNPGGDAGTPGDASLLDVAEPDGLGSAGDGWGEEFDSHDPRWHGDAIVQPDIPDDVIPILPVDGGVACNPPEAGRHNDWTCCNGTLCNGQCVAKGSNRPYCLCGSLVLAGGCPRPLVCCGTLLGCSSQKACDGSGPGI